MLCFLLGTNLKTRESKFSSVQVFAHVSGWFDSFELARHVSLMFTALAQLKEIKTTIRLQFGIVKEI